MTPVKETTDGVQPGMSVHTTDGPPRAQRKAIAKALTGIEGFDEISGGGLPRGRLTAIVGAAGAGNDAGPGTDFDAVANGFVSVTPLAIDFTRHAALSEVGRWLEGL